MKINKGIEAMIRGRKDQSPNFRLSSKRVFKLGKREIHLNLDFSFVIKKKTDRGE